MRTRHDWSAIQKHYDAGNAAAQCRKRFSIHYGAWAMARRRGKLRLASPADDGRKRHDWQLVQRYYDEGHSLYECMRAFKFSRGAWHKAVRRSEIRPRPLGLALDTLLVCGKSRRNIKIRLLRAGILENRCCECGLAEWQGQPLTVQIDHINGVRDDHRLANLRMLCPNCHSQTDTYGRRKRQPAGLQERTSVP